MCRKTDSPPEKIPRRKPHSEAGCIVEIFTPKKGSSLKILVAGTRNHGVSSPPPGGQDVTKSVGRIVTYIFSFVFFVRG